MIDLQVRGLSTVIARMDQRIQALSDLRPAMRVFAKDMRSETAAAFDKTRSPKGDVWDKLKPSTIAGRKVKKGKSPAKRAATSLEAMLSASLGSAGLKPLDDTGRLKRSIGYVATRDGFKFFAVGYLRPHVTGGGGDNKHPPKRNPTPFENVGGKYQLIPRLQTRLLHLVRDHVMLRRVA